MLSAVPGTWEVLSKWVVGEGSLEEVRLEVDFGDREERKGVRKAGEKQHFKRPGRGMFIVQGRPYATWL